MNSSKEVVKASRKLAAMPGAAIGSEIRRSTVHGPAPRSATPASSTARL